MPRPSEIELVKIAMRRERRKTRRERKGQEIGAMVQVLDAVGAAKSRHVLWVGKR